MLKRLLGFIMILIGLVGIALSIAGTIVGRQTVEAIGDGLETTLQLTSESLDTVNDTLVLTQTTVGQVNDGLETVEETAVNLSKTISDTRPLLTEVSQVTTEDVPEGIEAVQATIPDMAEVAGVIDDTLVTLDAFQVNQSILGVPIRFNLGIDYDPDQPFDETVTELGTSLDGLPDRLRALEVHLDTTNENLALISDNIETIAGNLDTINSSVADVEPLLDDYIRLVTETNDLIRQTRSGIKEQLATVTLIITILFVWLGLTQVAPLYLGFELLIGRRSRPDDDEPAGSEETLIVEEKN